MNWLYKFGYISGIIALIIFVIYKYILAIAFSVLVFDSLSFDLFYFIGTIEALSLTIIGLYVIEQLYKRMKEI